MSRRTDGPPTTGRSATRRAEGEIVYGLHPVQELIGSRPREVERLFVEREREGRMGRLLRAARAAGIPATRLSRELLARKVGGGALHQGVAAQVASFPYADPEALVRAALGRPPGLLVLVDGVVDPGNLGSILRTSAASGVHGVLLARDGTVGLTSAVAKTAAGALEHIAVAREPKPPARLRSLGDRGFRVLALAPGGSAAWDTQNLRGPTVLVVGGEERGVRPGVLASCHESVAIPLAPGVQSLNVAVALGVLLFEAVRQRRLGPARTEANLERDGTPW